MRGVLRRTYILLFLFIFVLLITTQQKAQAHPMNNGYSQIVIENRTINYDLTIPEPSLLVFDSNKDKQLSLDELNSQRSSVEQYLRTHLQIEVASERLEPTLISMEKTEETGIPAVLFKLRFTSKSYVESFTVQYTLLFDDVDPMHTNFAFISQGDDIDQAIFDTTNRTYHFEPLVKPNMLSSVFRYFVLGIKHIVTGYDHLLFLLSLIIVATRLSDIVRIVTAFTIAHSITLFLAATGQIHMNSRWIESGIALTIAYVAIENPFLKSTKLRWLITFCFGLVHGLGFAGAISEIGLPEKYLISSLLSFNVGVETGQLAIVLIVLPLLLRLQKLHWYRKLVIGVSAIIFVIAAYWFLQRVGVIS